jgi:hypothetical protein
MKIAVLVTSVIAPNLTVGLLKTPDRRSGIPYYERLRHTTFTVCNIRNTIPNADIFLIDGSEFNFAQCFEVFEPSCKFIHLATGDLDRARSVNTHPNKSYGELLLIDYALNTLNLQEYDYIIKISGRYFYDNFDSSWFNEANIGRYLFKEPQTFDWDNNFELIDCRAVDGPVFKQYCSVFYGVGREQLAHYQQLVAKSMAVSAEHYHYHMELLLYFYTRDLEEDRLLHIPLRVIGWDGISTENRLVCY